MRIFEQDRGFTLIELILVVTIAALLITVAMRGASSISHSVRVEETKQEMRTLAWAVTGNPFLMNHGVRSDFGYVGDNGALPPDLDALVSDPGLGTWNGPYLTVEWLQDSDDYKQDAWDEVYTFNGLEIVSTGSGSDIVRRLAQTTAELTSNQVRGLIVDRSGHLPGNDYMDSITVQLTHPDGLGGSATRTTTPEAGGLFEVGTVPIGVHDLTVIYQPSDDTLRRFVCVLPGTTVYGEHRLPVDFP